MTAQDLIPVAVVAASLVVVVVMQGQCRKPRWWPGRLVLKSMNARHSGVTDWGLAHLALRKDMTILDVGCGGGRTIQKLADIAGDGKVCGIDYSAASVAAARSLNDHKIQSGRVEIQQASVSSLPHPDATFDAVTAVETHYYWPNLVADLREILRVLKPGGTLVIIAETYRRGVADWLLWLVMKTLGAKYYSESEHRGMLERAGFSEVEVQAQPKKGWICAIGRRPSSSPGTADRDPASPSGIRPCATRRCTR